VREYHATLQAGTFTKTAEKPKKGLPKFREIAANSGICVLARYWLALPDGGIKRVSKRPIIDLLRLAEIKATNGY